MQCLSVHVGSQRKKLCPYCRQKIASTAVNLSLQRLIDSFVNLQDRRHHIAQADHDKELFLDRLSAAETRSCILRNELAEALERRKVKVMPETPWQLFWIFVPCRHLHQIELHCWPTQAWPVTPY